MSMELIAVRGAERKKQKKLVFCLGARAGGTLCER
jgi:hypothetical protein